MSEAARARGPLAGVRVLDLTRLLPGPVATLHLADLGADVIKIEDAGAGDYARTMGAGAEAGSSVFFAAVNRNKRGLVLDLKQAAGVATFLRLAETADVVVESFRPGVVDRLGVGYAVVAARNPRIVYCAITGYGQDGPWRDLAGHDLNYIATAGVLDQNGCGGGAPAIPNLQIGDLLGGGLTAAMGILAALVEARSSGQGRYVDVAMAEAVLAHHLFPFFHAAAGEAVPARGADELSGRDPWYAVYRTADDGWMAVGALEEKFWQGFCAALGRPDLVACHGARGEAAEALRRELEALFASRPRAEWEAVFATADCCVTPVLSPSEALRHPQFRARKMLVDAAGQPHLAPPLKMSDWDFAVRQAAPKAGEHAEAILGEAGFTAAEIAQLHADRVI
jgi:crotonobetainyl-CoA:carnitine CoA-transferase CaiB-like acyl-CoA transferase